MIKIKIYKTYKIPLDNLSILDSNYLFLCNKESAKVWNECVRLNRELWVNENKYIDRDYLQIKLKGFSILLPAKSIQITIKKYLQAIKGIQKARKVGRKDEKYPWREKKHYNTMWDKQMITIKDKYIYLSRPKCMRKLNDVGKLKPNPIKIYSKYIPPNICYAEVLYDNGLKLALNYYVESDDYKQINSNEVSAIDLGEIHTITSVDTLENTQIITGRRLRSYQRFRNKELGKLQKKLSKCKKNSRNYKKYRQAIQKLMSKSNRKISNELHKTSKMYINYLVENNIQNVVVGDLTKYNMNLKNIKGSGKLQKLVQWNHGQLMNMLNYKSKRYDIRITEISEKYTSQTCPCCSNKYKPTGRNYICKVCGFTLHRDIVGAYNILSKYINNGEIKKMDLKLKELKYLRIA